MKNEISIARLNELLVYDECNGLLRHRAIVEKCRHDRMRNTRFAGKTVGCVNSLGYVVLKIDGVWLMAHRVIWAMKHGAWPQGELDHASDRADNRMTRPATHAQNQWNKGRTRRNTTGHKNVSRDGSRWRVEIMKEGRRVRLRFYTLEAAIAAANAYRSILHGEFANHG